MVQVTLMLPDDAYALAEQIAQQSGRDVGSILAETLSEQLRMDEHHLMRPVELLTDDELLQAIQATFPAPLEQWYAELLDRQQSGGLTELERFQLLQLVEIDQAGTLRKAKALVEAVSRGIWED